MRSVSQRERPAISRRTGLAKSYEDQSGLRWQSVCQGAQRNRAPQFGQVVGNKATPRFSPKELGPKFVQVPIGISLHLGAAIVPPHGENNGDTSHTDNSERNEAYVNSPSVSSFADKVYRVRLPNSCLRTWSRFTQNGMKNPIIPASSTISQRRIATQVSRRCLRHAFTVHGVDSIAY